MALSLTDIKVLIQLIDAEVESLDSVANHSFVDSQTADDCAKRLALAKQTASNLKETYESMLRSR